MTFPDTRASLPRPSARLLFGALTAVAVVVGLLTAVPAQAASRKVTLSAAAATWANRLEPSTVKAGSGLLALGKYNSVTYLKYDVRSAVPAGATITGAELSMTVRTSKATTAGLRVRATSSSWKASELTWDNRPSVGGDSDKIGPLVRPVKGQVARIKLDAAAVKDAKVLSLALTEDEAGVGVTLYSSGNKAPRLTVSYEPAPRSTATATATSTPKPTASASTPVDTDPTNPLPYDQASGGSKQVWAHYMPNLPISFDNADPSADYYARGYLSPTGESGKHAAYGGMVRDRPAGRAPLSGNWRLADMVTEVKNAKAAGIDGFTVDVLGINGDNWDRTKLLTSAAEQVGGFTIVPNIDTNGSAAKSGTITDLAAALAPILSGSAAHRLPDGRVVLSSFLAEGRSVTWWTDLFTELDNTYGIKVAFVAVLLDCSESNMKAFAPVSWSLSEWGMRNPGALAARPGYAAKAHALGVRWMEPVAVQDMRPRSGIFDEAANTGALRASWNRAITQGADAVQMVTWNDYAETTSFAPSAGHGYAFLDASGYWASWFKSGQEPKVVRDGLFLTHRRQPVAAPVTGGQTVLMSLRSGSAVTPAQDTVEVLAMLTAPAKLTITVGSSQKVVDAPAGVSVHTVPLEAGAVSANAVRSGAQVARVDSPVKVTTSVVVQDLQYVGASSRR